MSSTKQDKREGVQPLDADDGVLADSMSDEELSGASEGDGPLHHAEEAEFRSTISGDGPEILRVHAVRTSNSKVHGMLCSCSCDLT